MQCAVSKFASGQRHTVALPRKHLLTLFPQIFCFAKSLREPYIRGRCLRSRRKESPYFRKFVIGSGSSLFPTKLPTLPPCPPCVREGAEHREAGGLERSDPREHNNPSARLIPRLPRSRRSKTLHLCSHSSRKMARWTRSHRSPVAVSFHAFRAVPSYTNPHFSITLPEPTFSFAWRASRR